MCLLYTDDYFLIWVKVGQDELFLSLIHASDIRLEKHPNEEAEPPPRIEKIYVQESEFIKDLGDNFILLSGLIVENLCMRQRNNSRTELTSQTNILTQNEQVKFNYTATAI